MLGGCWRWMPSECWLLPIWEGSIFCDPMKGGKDNFSGRRHRGEWVSTAGKSAQWAACGVDARGRWSIGLSARRACPLAGFAYPMRTPAFSGIPLLLAPSIATVGPILTGGEGVAPRAWRAHNDPIWTGRILSQWHRLPTPRDCAGRPISEAQKKKGGAGLARAERHQSAVSPRGSAQRPTTHKHETTRHHRGHRLLPATWRASCLSRLRHSQTFIMDSRR